jgi:hypothetical protein
MKVELVRVEHAHNMPKSPDKFCVFIGAVLVRSCESQKQADDLAAAIGVELQKEFEVRARWVAKESRYREVRHY